MLNVGFFVTFFSALLYVPDTMGLLSVLVRALARTGLLSEGECRCLIWSFFELSGSVGLLSSHPLTPSTLAVASFALSWGGALRLLSERRRHRSGRSLRPDAAAGQAAARAAGGGAGIYYVNSFLLSFSRNSLLTEGGFRYII